MLEEFKKFALKGNMVELAVGVIIGTAFSGLVNSIVNDMFMPVLGVFTGGLDFSNIYWQMVGQHQPTLDAARKAGATLAYGHFITILINFLIISFVLFIVIKGLNRLQLAKSIEEETQKPTTPTEQLLSDIRDILRADQSPAQAKALAAANAARAAKEAAADAAKAPPIDAAAAAANAFRRFKNVAAKTVAAAHGQPAEAEAGGKTAAPKTAKAKAAARPARRKKAAKKTAAKKPAKTKA